MKMTTDLDLLREYAQRGSEKAFAALVTRHLDLVYSTALRQVKSSQLAEDIAQSVFTDLAKNAHGFKPDTVLAAWLYQVTRRTALNVSRSEGRRQAREQIAVELADMNATSSDWTQIEPWLDEAMETLDEPDRAAILLRYFENQSLRDVGKTLGVGEDAAQKRVSRAVERLREFFAKRGVAVGASGLATVISSNAIQAVPAGLAAALSSAVFAGTVAGPGIATGILKIMTITKLKAAVASTIIAVGVTTSLVFQQQARAKIHEQDESRRRQSDQLARLKAENYRLSGVAGPGENFGANNLDNLLKLRAEVKALREQTNTLAKLREENHRLRAPSPQTAGRAKTPLEEREDATENAIAKMNYTRQWGLALMMYAGDHDGEFPARFEEATSYFSKTDASFSKTDASTNLTTGQFELVYQGQLNAIKDTANTIIVREKQASQSPGGKWAKAYLFADGHSEIHSEPDGDFNAFEKKRVISRPNP